MTRLVRLTLFPLVCLACLSASARAQSVQTFASGPGWAVTNSVGTPVGSSTPVCLDVATPSSCPAGAVVWNQPGGGWEQDLTAIPGAEWIWAPGFTGTDIGNLARFTFTKTITLAGTPTAGTVYMTADDLVEVRVNGTLVSTHGSVTTAADTAAYAPLKQVNILPFLVAGANTIAFTGQNGPGSFSGDPNADYSRNPAGVVFGGSITTGTFTTVQPPSGLYTASVDASNVVTLKWTPPVNGPAPTGYVLKGGAAPGQVLAALPTGSTAPAFRFAAPQGAFYVRVHSVNGATESAASNEIPLVVNVPVTPSAPADFLGVADNTTISLSWRPTYDGGAASSYLLDVTGSVAASIPLPASTSLTLSGAPAGTYSLRLRGVNAAGPGPASAPVPLALPSALCQSVPLAPRGVSAIVSGRQVTLLWDSAVSGRAATSYNVRVTGTANVAFPSAARQLTAAAPPGTYTFFVSASNICGTGPESAGFTFTVQ